MRWGKKWQSISSGRGRTGPSTSPLRHVHGPDLRHRRRPIGVVLRIADRALRADIAGACEGADIAVAANTGRAHRALASTFTRPPPYPPRKQGDVAKRLPLR